MKNVSRSRRGARRLLLSGCIVLWLTAFVMTHTPAATLPKGMPGDKLLHFLGYMLLAAVFLLTMSSYGQTRPRRVATAIVVMMIYAGLDEITQPLVNRYASVTDWLADAAGVLAAVILAETVLHLRQKWLQTSTQ